MKSAKSLKNRRSRNVVETPPARLRGLSAVAVAAAIVLVGAVGSGQGQSQTGDLETLRQEIAALRAEVEGLKAAFKQAPAQPQQARGPVAGAAVSLDGAPAKGDDAAPITIVEYSDYECPFCARYASQTLPQILQQYVDTGKVRYVFKSFPLESIHQNAFSAHVAASCSGEQDQYWAMHDRLFANQSALGAAERAGHAEAVGLDTARFNECLESGRHSDAVRADITSGQEIGVRGTPTFLIGRTADGGQFEPASVLVGSQPYPAFQQAIDGLLSPAPAEE